METKGWSFLTAKYWQKQLENATHVQSEFKPLFSRYFFFLQASFSFFFQGNLNLRCNEAILKLQPSKSNWIMHPGKSLTNEKDLFPAQLYSLTKICNLKLCGSICDLEFLYNEKYFSFPSKCQVFCCVLPWTAVISLSCELMLHLYAQSSQKQQKCLLQGLRFAYRTHLLETSRSIYLVLLHFDAHEKKGWGVNDLVVSAGNVFRITFFWDPFTIWVELKLRI